MPPRERILAARGRRRRRRERRVVMLAAGMLAAATSVGGVQPTEAVWTNAEHATTTVSALTVTPPTIASCAYAGSLAAWTATFSLSGLTAGTTVRYRLYQPGTTTIAASGSFAVTGATLAVPIAQGGLLGRWRVELEVVRAGWVSTVTVGHVATLLGLVGSCGSGP